MNKEEIGQRIFDWCIRCKGAEEELGELIESIKIKNWRTVEDFLVLNSKDLLRTDEYIIGLTILANAYQGRDYDPYCISDMFAYIVAYQMLEAGNDISDWIETKDRTYKFLWIFSDVLAQIIAIEEIIDVMIELPLNITNIENLKFTTMEYIKELERKRESLVSEKMGKAVKRYIATAGLFDQIYMFGVSHTTFEEVLFEDEDIDIDIESEYVIEALRHIIQNRKVYDVQIYISDEVFFSLDAQEQREVRERIEKRRKEVQKEIREHYYTFTTFKIHFLLEQGILQIEDAQQLFEIDPELERRYLARYGLQKVQRAKQKILI